MGLFRKKKIERPKSPLGLSLYQYDNILGKDLKKIMDRMNTGKRLNEARAGAIIENAIEKFDDILRELSKDQLKVDYRSDKIRYKIIDMINKLKNALREAKNNSFKPSANEKAVVFNRMQEIEKIRSVIKNKMRDIESDYI